MEVPRLRLTVRKMMLAVAITAVPLVGLSEHAYRQNRAVYHERQQRLGEERSRDFQTKARAALAQGRREEAALGFALGSHWTEMARGHESSGWTSW